MLAMEQASPTTNYCGREKGTEPRSESSNVVISFEGRKISSRIGESLLAALVAAGEYHLRTTKSGESRGPFCGMGVCQECLVEIDGAPCQRACVTKVEKPIAVKRQIDPVSISGRAKSLESAGCEKPSGAIKPDIAVVGGGAGGMNAAIWAARSGADVLLIDERPQLGGQYFKQLIPAPDLEAERWEDKQFRNGRHLIGEIAESGIKLLNNASVVAAFEPCDLLVSRNKELTIVKPKKLIVATGAYELGLLVPGWTLPGVMTTGSAQVLLRSYRVLAGRKVLIAGNGPLNFQVGLELAKAGAEVKAIAEASPAPSARNMRAFLEMLAGDPELTVRGASYLAGLIRRGVPIHYSASLASVQPITGAGGPLLKTVLRDWTNSEATEKCYEVDAVCIGYGFAPSNEILRALGCRSIVNETKGTLDAVRGDDCETTREPVFAVGDCARFGGSRIAECEGVIAGNAAARSLGFEIPGRAKKAVKLARSSKRRQQNFQSALWTMFKPAEGLFKFPGDEVIACRCEEVAGREIADGLMATGSNEAGSLKRSTRAGMGRCQGRYCGPEIARFLIDSGLDSIDETKLWAPRPPIKPVTVASLANFDSFGPN